MKDKAVLITGGAKHLGKTIALAMAQEGAQVAFTYLSSPDEANQTLTQVKKASETAMALKCDVRSSSSIAEAVKAVAAKFGRLDVLVNNAGFYEDARFPDITAVKRKRLILLDGSYLTWHGYRTLCALRDLPPLLNKEGEGGG